MQMSKILTFMFSVMLKYVEMEIRTHRKISASEENGKLAVVV